MSGSAIIDDLQARRLLHDSTDLDGLRTRLDAGPIGVYCGFDPTADSLHIGSIVPLLLLRRFQDHGHRPIALAGGATGMIGDPSGRSDERNLLDDASLSRNVAGITPQLARFLDFDRPSNPARLVDNRDWTGPLTAIEFLRDVGKHITVNQMLAKESVKARVDSESGISFTEFSYMLLQANDFRWLLEHEDCELQVGGSDQWGNITAGIDLIRKATGRHVHGLTVPLVTKADGSKFGKTAAGTVWLDAARTSPYEFFQYWINTDDRDVERFLLQMTLLPVEEVRGIVEAHAAAPDARAAQRRLAREVTALVHGAGAAEEAEKASAGFTRGAGDHTPAELEALVGEIPTTWLAEAEFDGIDLIDLLCRTALATSKSDARRSIEGGGVNVNDVRQSATRPVGMDDLLDGRFVMLRKGKKVRHLVVVGEPPATRST